MLVCILLQNQTTAGLSFLLNEHFAQVYTCSIYIYPVLSLDVLYVYIFLRLLISVVFMYSSSVLDLVLSSLAIVTVTLSQLRHCLFTILDYAYYSKQGD